MGSIRATELDDLPHNWRPDNVSNQTNALGRPPEPVLFLWPFARPMNLRAQVIGHGWPKIGPVHMLLRPGLGMTKWKHRSMSEVHEAMQSFDYRVGWQRPPQLRFGDGVWRKYHGYPVLPLTVGGSIWEETIELLAQRCGFFVADMTMKKGAGGLSAELHMLFSHFPPDRIALLVDGDRADISLCAGHVEAAWRSSGAHGSYQAPEILIYHSNNKTYVKHVMSAMKDKDRLMPIAAKALGRLGW